MSSLLQVPPLFTSIVPPNASTHKCHFVFQIFWSSRFIGQRPINFRLIIIIRHCYSWALSLDQDQTSHVGPVSEDKDSMSCRTKKSDGYSTRVLLREVMGHSISLSSRNCLMQHVARQSSNKNGWVRSEIRLTVFSLFKHQGTHSGTSKCQVPIYYSLHSFSFVYVLLLRTQSCICFLVYIGVHLLSQFLCECTCHSSFGCM